MRCMILMLVFAAALLAAGFGDERILADDDSSASAPSGGSLLEDRSRAPIIKPAMGKPARADRPKIPAAMKRNVVDRSCRLAAPDKNGQRVFHFLDEPNRPPIAPRIALPCGLGLLEAAEKMANANPDQVFRVSGETTLYKRKSYLLLSKLTVPAAPEKAATTKPTESHTQPKTSPATSPAETDKTSAKAMMEQMLSRQTPASPVFVTPGNTEEKAPSVAPVPAGVVSAAIVGGMVIDRLVRIMPEKSTARLMVHFESDNTLQEPPMILLPCKMLEKAERAAKGYEKVKDPRFRISGNMYLYKGRRYLLLRKFLTEPYMGQF